MKVLAKRFGFLFMVVTFSLVLNIFTAKAAEDEEISRNENKVEAYQEDEGSIQEVEQRAGNLEFSGVVQNTRSKEVYTFTVPATGTYSLSFSTSFVSGGPSITLSITQDGGYFTSINSQNGRISKNIKFYAGRTYKITLITDNDAYYGYSGTIYSY